jgi:putative transposase
VYRWLGRQRAGCLADRIVVPRPTVAYALPEEIAHVCQYAEVHAELGYKRMAWAMVDENVAYLRPWMVYAILADAGLLGRRQPLPADLHRPPDADHADQRWHTDLMTLSFAGRWFWLVDVLDAYSRYLVHYEVLLTARAEVVQLAAQRAVDTLAGRRRYPGEPEIVHDQGPQYVSREWLLFVQAAAVFDKLKQAHPVQF